MRKCGKCLEVKELSEFTFSKAKKQYHYACQSCVKEVNRKYYLANKRKIIEQVAQYREDNRDKTRALATKCFKRKYVALRLKAISRYGAKCTCCGENGLEFLCIDHVDNDGKAHREEIKNIPYGIYGWLNRNNYPPNRFQILCHNCNFSKYQNGGKCIHQSPEGPTTILKGSRAKRLEARDA